MSEIATVGCKFIEFLRTFSQKFYQFKCCMASMTSVINLFLNGPSPASFSFNFGLFQTDINTILQQINVKNVHPEYGTGI